MAPASVAEILRRHYAASRAAGRGVGGRRTGECAEIADLRALRLSSRDASTPTPRRRDLRRVTEDQLQELCSAYLAARRELRGAIARAKTRSHEGASSRPSTRTLEGARTRPCRANSGPWAPPVTEGLEPRFSPGGAVGAVSPLPRFLGVGGVDASGDPEFVVGHRHSGCPEGHGRGARRPRCFECVRRTLHPDRTGCPGEVWAWCSERPRGRPQARVRRGLEDREVSPRVERGEVSAAAEARKARGVTLGLSTDLSTGRGGQALGARYSCPPLGPTSEPRSSRICPTANSGFRLQRSTVDAILLVRSLSRRAAEGGGVSVWRLSLDIANAFNTVSWAAIERALVFHSVPLYLRRLVWDYLRGRVVSYVGRDGDGGGSRAPRRATGVRSGASAMEPGVRRGVAGGDAVTGRVARVCYADDTLVVHEAQGGSVANVSLV